MRESGIGPRRLRSLGERLDPSAATQCLDLNAAIDQAAFATCGWTDPDPVPGRYETDQGARWNIVPPPARRTSQQAAQELASGAPRVG